MLTERKKADIGFFEWNKAQTAADLVTHEGLLSDERLGLAKEYGAQGEISEISRERIYTALCRRGYFNGSGP